MNKVFKYYVRVIFFLFPIAFLPMLTDSFGLGKNLILGIMAFLGLLLWGVKLITEKEKVVRTNKLFWLFVVFAIWSAITFFRLDNGSKMLSLMLPMGMGTIISLLVLFFVLLQVDDKEEYEKQFLFLTFSGVITGVVSLIVFLLPTNSLPLSIPKSNPLVTITNGWSLTGSLLAELTLFLLLVLGWVKKLIGKIKERVGMNEYLVEAVVAAFFTLWSLLDIYRMVRIGWVSLDLNSSWVIAVETLKKSPLFGVGVGNFLEAFNLYRPASFNLTKYWANTFSGSSMGVLQIWTELGLVGLALTAYLVAMVLKLKKKTIKFGQLALLLIAILLLPWNMVVAFLLVWLLSVSFSESKETRLVLNVGEKSFNVMPYVVGVVILAAAGFSGFMMGKMFLGDFYMRKSLVAATKNDGNNTYEMQIKAIEFNPNVAGYRKIYSQTNLSLAKTILNQEKVSDEDKQKASTLVQQAVRESKSAVSLSQKNPDYWYNLANVYKSLVGLVDQAAIWSYQAYQQAVALDTVNPTYYLDMGGLLYAAGEYDQAERVFEEAVTNKSDYANAWYNWAYSAKQQNKLALAVSRMEQALKLVPADSSDYQTAVKELDGWKTELAKATEAAQKQQAAQNNGGQNQGQTQQQAPATGQELPGQTMNNLAPETNGGEIKGVNTEGNQTLVPPQTGGETNGAGEAPVVPPTQ